jgi:hypothetical protein
MKHISKIPLIRAENVGQGFVKFFGESSNRESRNLPVIKEVVRAGCHWACTYPKSKKPRGVRDNAVIFMGRLVTGPNDILIFGRGLAMRYVDGRDDATNAEIEQRPWRERWPRYVRVHDVEFIEGNLSDGISLNELIERFGSYSFVSTKRNALAGSGNTNPRRALSQQPAVELTPEAITWMNQRLDRCFENLGRISSTALAKLDWPDAVIKGKLPGYPRLS